MFRLLVVLAVLISTLMVIVTEPKMHKRVIIGDKGMLVEQNFLDVRNVKISPPKNEIKPADIQGTRTGMNVQNSDITREEYMKQIRMRSPKVKEYNFEQTQGSNISAPVRAERTKTGVKSQSAQKPLQESEETASDLDEMLNDVIIWNEWRANICNTISDNSLREQVYHLKMGVLFRYSFYVDRDGNISNIKVVLARGESNSVTQDSVRDIYKTIKSLEGRNILIYPKGSKRTIVKVEGGIEMAGADVNLSPSNFSDIEF